MHNVFSAKVKLLNYTNNNQCSNLSTGKSFRLLPACTQAAYIFEAAYNFIMNQNTPCMRHRYLYQSLKYTRYTPSRPAFLPLVYTLLALCLHS